MHNDSNWTDVQKTPGSRGAGTGSACPLYFPALVCDLGIFSVTMSYRLKILLIVQTELFVFDRNMKTS